MKQRKSRSQLLYQALPTEDRAGSHGYCPFDTGCPIIVAGSIQASCFKFLTS